MRVLSFFRENFDIHLKGDITLGVITRSMSLIDGLNKEQKEAVLSTDGPMLVIAGAGSGKTRVLTHRIAYLINENGVAPWNILAITFTNRAAKEMKERLESIIGSERASSTWVSTFHSTCVRILRRDITSLGYTTNFTIYDDSDKKRLVRECMKRYEIDEKQIKPRKIMTYISDAKNRFVTPDEAKLEASGNYFEELQAKVYADYENGLKNNNSLDFDDLLVKALELLQNNSEVLNYYQEKFKYILVDEYQDTNKVQYMIVKLLGAKYKNVFVVGDDDQSIYGWRGADISNILNFEKDYTNAGLIRLEQNYRSTQNILDLANKVIANNTQRKEKNLWSDNGSGDVATIYPAIDDREEAKFVADEIKKRVEAGDGEYKDFAVMYRTNAQSRAIEEAVSKYMMPYQVYGSVRFYDRKEVKDIICYLNAIVNEKDAMAIKRIINVPKRKIGETSIEKIEQCALQNDMAIYEVLRKVRVFPELSKIATKVESFVDIIEEMKMKSINGSITELATELVEKIKYESMLKEECETEEEATERMENVQELISKIAYFEQNTEEPTLEKFLAEVMLMTDSDNLEESDNRIKLMTIHVAKGLEFNNVFLVGFEDGLFPSLMCNNEEGVLEDELEEERRLLYVAITRAKKKLYISHAAQRMKFGKIEPSKISRFLDEFPKELYSEIEREKKKISKASIPGFDVHEKKPAFATLSSFTAKPKEKDVNMKISKVDFAEGDQIMHVKFGKGEVKEITQMNFGDPTVTIIFEQCGEKKFICGPKVLANIKKIS